MRVDISGDVVVDHCSDRFDVQSSSSNICSDQSRKNLVLVVVHRLITLVLLHITVQTLTYMFESHQSELLAVASESQ